MSRPLRIFLLRHGESQGNVDRAIHATVPDWKIELTARGREQAQAAGVKLADTISIGSLGVYISPYRRTMQTWETVAKHLGSLTSNLIWVKQDPRLREQEWGTRESYENKPWSDIEKERDDHGTFFYRFKHGESGADVYDRCTGFLETAYRDFDGAEMPTNVLIVTHGFTMRVLLMRWLHWTVDEIQELANPRNCEMVELRLGSDGKHYQLVNPFPRKSEREWRP